MEQSIRRRRRYVPEVAVVVEDEASRHRLDDHLGRVDPQKDVPVSVRKEGMMNDPLLMVDARRGREGGGAVSYSYN